PTLGTKKPNAAAARISAGKTVTARRAERSSAVRAGRAEAAPARWVGAGGGVLMRGTVLPYETSSQDVDARWALPWHPACVVPARIDPLRGDPACVAPARGGSAQLRWRAGTGQAWTGSPVSTAARYRRVISARASGREAPRSSREVTVSICQPAPWRPGRARSARIPP